MKKLDGGFKPLDPVIDHETEPESRKNDGSSLAQLLRRLEEGLPNTFDQEMISAGAQLRKLNAPRAETAAKTRKGVWVGESFVLADEYVPEKYNDKKRTIAQIKKDLSETYGIHVNSISYIDGIADFRPISVAHILTADIVKRATGISDKKYESLSQLNRTRLFQKVFSAERDGVSKRERNFDLADQLTAEQQIQIPGLEAGYSATDLKAWRSKNNFSWDEQVSGYHLVPTIIHGNLPHTGLVSTAKNAYSYLKRRKQDLAAHPEKYCWDEQTAPISIDEAKVLAKKQNRKTKGGSDMASARRTGKELFCSTRVPLHTRNASGKSKRRR